MIREWSVALFRMVGYIPLLFISSLSSAALTGLLIAMALALFIEPFLIRSIQTDLSSIE